MRAVPTAKRCSPTRPCDLHFRAKVKPMSQPKDAAETARTLLAVSNSGGELTDAHSEVLQVCAAYLSEEPAMRAPFYLPIAFIFACMALGVVGLSAALGILFYRVNVCDCTPASQSAADHELSPK